MPPYLCFDLGSAQLLSHSAVPTQFLRGVAPMDLVGRLAPEGSHE
jgi:hypothetical protein